MASRVSEPPAKRSCASVGRTGQGAATHQASSSSSMVPDLNDFNQATQPDLVLHECASSMVGAVGAAGAGPHWAPQNSLRPASPSRNLPPRPASPPPVAAPLFLRQYTSNYEEREAVPFTVAFDQLSRVLQPMNNPLLALMDSTTEGVLYSLAEWLVSAPSACPVAASAEERAPLTAEAVLHAYVELDRLMRRTMQVLHPRLSIRCLLAKPTRIQLQLQLQQMLQACDMFETASASLAWAVCNMHCRESSRIVNDLGVTQDTSELATADPTTVDPIEALQQYMGIEQIATRLRKHLTSVDIWIEHTLECETDLTLAEQGINRRIFHRPISLASPDAGMDWSQRLEVVRLLRRNVNLMSLPLAINTATHYTGGGYSPKYVFSNPTWRRLFGSHRLYRIVYHSPFYEIWADPEDEHKAQAMLGAHMACKSEWVHLQYRCLRAIHKASGNVLDDTCEMKLTPDSWRVLAQSTTTKFIPMPPGFGVAQEDLTRIDPRRCTMGLLYVHPKPTKSVPGTTSEDLRFFLDQLEWRVFHADILMQLKYGPTGVLQRHTAVVLRYRMTDEVRCAAEVAKGVYEPVEVSERSVDTDTAEATMRVQAVQDRLYLDHCLVEPGSSTSARDERKMVVKRFMELRLTGHPLES